MSVRQWAARAAAVVVAVLLGAATAVPVAGLSGTAAPAAADEHASLRVVVDSVDPAVLRPGEDQRVRVVVTNDGTRTVERPRLLLHLDRRSFISRSSLDRWRTAASTDPVGAAVARLDLEDPLPPGESVRATIELPASDVGLRRDVTSWGPRGMAVEAVDLDDPARRRLDLARTFLLWFPAEEVTPTRVTVLVPLTGPPVDPWTDGWVEDLDEVTGPDGRLGRVLAATAAQRHVTWAVDPWLVEATQESPGPGDDGTGSAADDDPGDAGQEQGGEEQTDEEQGGEEQGGEGQAGEGQAGAEEDGAEEAGASTGTAAAFGPAVARAGPQARAWADEMLASLTGRDVELLPYLDPDLGALAHAREEDLLRLARDRAAEVAVSSPLPDSARATVAWPADALPDLSTAALGAGSTGRGVLVGPGQLRPPSVLTYTPSGRSTVRTSRGDVAVLVPDDRLSAAVRTGDPLADPLAEPDAERGSAPDVAGLDDEDFSPRPPTPATAGQDVLAELAVVTRERPSDGRHLLATVPRDWDPEPAVVEAVLGAMASAPWVRTEGLSALVGAPDPGVDRGSLPGRVTHDAELAAEDMASIAGDIRARRALAAIVPDPTALLGDTELEVLAPLSVAWRDERVGRSVLVSRSVAATQAVRDAVTVVPGAALNLISASGGLPVRVANGLPQEVTVEVGLRPGDARLRADETVTAVVPAGGEQTVLVPVHAIQSADLDVAVEIRTQDGDLLDDDTVLLVRVRADWEGIGTAVIAALLALGMVVGLVRAVRRGRRTSRRGRPQRLGPDALSPEAQDSDAAADTDPRPPGRETTDTRAGAT